MSKQTKKPWQGRFTENTNEFVEEFQGKDPAIVTSALIRELSELRAVNFQLIEHLGINWQVSNKACENSHIAVQKYEESDGTSKSQGRNFSERLERLEQRFG